MTERVQKMIDEAGADGIISVAEKNLILRIAAKDNVDQDEIEFALLKYNVEEEKVDYDIEDAELIKRIDFWLSHAAKGKFKGMYDPFPKKKGEINRLDDGKALINKAIGTAKKLPGLGAVTKIGVGVAASVVGKEMTYQELVFEVERYLMILELRAEDSDVLRPKLTAFKLELSDIQEKGDPSKKRFGLF